jgi:hypothetical protein
MKGIYFKLGFFLSLICFLSANFYSYINLDYFCLDCKIHFGFPLRLWETGGFLTQTRIIWIGLIVDVLVALFVSICVGWGFQQIFRGKVTS